MLKAWQIEQNRQRDDARGREDAASWGNQPRVDYEGQRRAYEDHLERERQANEAPDDGTVNVTWQPATTDDYVYRPTTITL